jgi:phosphotransacetylase
MTISSLKDFAVEAQKMKKKTIIAVVEAQDEHTLESVIKATEDGIMIPALIGSAENIKALLNQFGADATKYEIIGTDGTDASLAKAVELISTGKATAIMKGKLESGQFMKAILNKENGLIQGDKLSLIGFYETPKYPKLFAVSDFGLNTYPNLQDKKAIIENAVRLLHAIGHENPKVAVLSSIEKVNPKMADSVDGDELKKMNQNGELTGCIIEGPISFDLATNKDAAKIKGYESPVAGDADLLIVPDIAAGNILVKCLTGFCDAQTAGTVLGAKVPVILTSRSAEANDKYYSIALAACAAANY